MKLSSVRDLKAELREAKSLVAAVAATALPEEAWAKPAPLALGVAGTKGDYKLAVRVQAAVPGVQTLIEAISEKAQGEIDVRIVGKVKKQQPWYRRRRRPLQIGTSIGHVKITAGTLGCFVTRTTGAPGTDYILSNNHVLANENLAKAGDTIIQPGKVDGGKASTDKIGELFKFVRLKQKANVVDAAIAGIDDGLEYYPSWLEDRGEIRGVRSEPLDVGTRVYKIGRTTGFRQGSVSAIEIDDLLVEYDMGVLEFDDQIEISPYGDGPFSLGGDSGSLIFDTQRDAVGLLFAGNDADATYANAIGAVFEKLSIGLVP